MKYIKLIIILILYAAAITVSAQQQMKIMSYNLLGYPGTDSTIRNPYFRTVISSSNPDILVVCEMTSQSGLDGFLSNVMNAGSTQYAAGTFITGTDTYNAIFYKPSKFNFISNTPIKTVLRDINEFKVVDKFYSDTLRIYMAHLKANLADSIQRGNEVDSLRKVTNKLPAGTNFVVAGDFNIYSANETAYKKLVKDNATDDGNFLDPFNMPGVWNNASYAPYHTQSTRVRSFGNGATGGLDDRFDMILYSNAVKNPGGIKFIPGTYTPYGNDGNHYNDSINKIPNTAVTQTIANALHYASDHLPVFATFEFGNATTLNLKVIPDGLYNSVLNKLNRRDSVSVYLRNNYSPYNIVDSSKSVIDSLTFTAPVIFRTAQNGNYYIQLKTINSIETWSKSGGVQYSIDSVMSFDFTTSITQAYGNNLVLNGTKYCIFNGDVNADGIIDLADIIETYNDGINFSTGYFVTDMNGDGVVDLADEIIDFNNAGKFVSKIVP